MLSAPHLRGVYSKHLNPGTLALRRHDSRLLPSVSAPLARFMIFLSRRPDGRFFNSGRPCRREALLTSAPSNDSPADVERVVREAKQRFRDTLPRDYLNDEEYSLYTRLYGPPLRETEPEDVGIPSHADMASFFPSTGQEGATLLRPVKGVRLEEVLYERRPTLQEEEDGGEEEQEGEKEERGTEDDLATFEAMQLGGQAQEGLNYVNAVARNRREHQALQRLAQDFRAAQQRQAEAEAVAGRSANRMEAANGDTDPAQSEHEEMDMRLNGPSEDATDTSSRPSGADRRFHPYTIEGKFHGNPVELILPRREFVEPIRHLLGRTHIKHVKEAAEAAFGGAGLPTSPATPEGRRKGSMGPVGLAPDQRHMSEIEADAFLAGYLPPAYASVMSILTEVRRRVGAGWLRERLANDSHESSLRVLDAGAGGAALVAWEQLLDAEWGLLREEGVVQGERPPGKKTVVASSDRLRNRIKVFLDNTTFLPRLPDYEHSGEAVGGEHLEAGDRAQPRKVFDVVIASHLFLKEKQGHRRQAVLNSLWKVLNPNGGILIVIEKAHPRGFEAVAHVRDTLLARFLRPTSGEPASGATATADAEPRLEAAARPDQEPELEPGHVVAPCTNQGQCPMYREEGTSRGRKDFCHFGQRFVGPSFYDRVLGRERGSSGDEVEFSYVAIQRGVGRRGSMGPKEATETAYRGYEASEERPDMQSLPRLIQPPLKRKGHVTLDVCTTEGQIERWVVPKSFSKLAYHDARKSRWGDLWALGAKTRVQRRTRVGSGGEDEDKAAAAAAAGRESKPLREKLRRVEDGGKEEKQRDLLKELLATTDDGDGRP